MFTYETHVCLHVRHMFVYICGLLIHWAVFVYIYVTGAC